MHPRRVFEDHLELIERVIAHVARKGRLAGPDAQDFASAAHVALMENDCAILARYDGRAPLDAYLAVVLHRLLCDERNRQLGRWRPSAEAKKMGDAGVLLETLLQRDHRPLREVAPIVAASHQTLTLPEIESMAARLPDRRPPLRAVALDDVMEETLAGGDDAASRVAEGEQRRIAETTAQVLRDAFSAMEVQDRVLMRMRFASSMTVSAIARIMGVPQRPLYRRIDTLLERLHRALDAAGIDASSIEAVIGSSVAELDFGLTARKTGDAEPYLEEKAGELP
jgi:RNA polymerase sigma factor (sigma-70 family)